MTARRLPGAWSSTPNAIEAQAYRAKNAVFTVDDFIPVGASWQQRQQQAAADRIFRAQGNQAGRARMRDNSALQKTMWPRGIIVSSGEDIPEGHSCRGRILIIELTPGDVSADDLTKAQEGRAIYNHAIAAWAQHLIARGIGETLERFKKEVESGRTAFAGVGHTRTPHMLADLTVAGTELLEFAETMKALPAATITKLDSQMQSAIRAIGEDQTRHLRANDPTDIFVDTLVSMLGANLVHIRSMNGGIPRHATQLGWTERGSQGDIASYTPHGPTIGWIDWDEDELYLEGNSSYALVTKHSRGQLSVTKNTLWKRMKDAALLKHVDPARSRNTVRKQCDGASRNCLVLGARATLTKEESE